ncbi:MAG: RNA methyltransferase [Betaproteobacteria bacterium]
MTRVTSPDNPRLKEAARLIASSRDRRKSGRCVLEGAHAIDAYCRRIGHPETLLVADDAEADPAIAALMARVPPSRTLTVTRAMLGELATLPADIGAIAVIDTPVAAPAPAGDFCLLLEDVQDPGNVGSMLRSAAAAGVGQAYLSRDCAFAWSPKVLRAAQGAHFHLAIYENVELVAWSQEFRRDGGTVMATVVRGGVPLFDAALPRKLALAIGNEGAGLTPALADAADLRVTIPMPGGTESLNAAVAAAICLFERVRRRGLFTG